MRGILHPGYNCLHVIVLGLAAGFHSLCTTAKKGPVHMGHVSVFGEPVATCCISAPCLNVLVTFVWCSVCHCLDVCVFCSPYIVLCAPLAGCVWCLYVPWPTCSSCWSAVLCAVSHCLDVFVACMVQLHVQCAIDHRWYLHVYVLLFMVSAPLSEGMCCFLWLMWAGYMRILCFLYLPLHVHVLIDYRL